MQNADGDKSQPFNGAIDNLIIWRNRALSALSIAQLYAGGVGMDPRFAFSNYSAADLAAVHVYYLMGDDSLDVINGGSAVINDQMSNINATPYNFETGDWDLGSW